ncbi:cobQ/CobB/MinD/ParA nucleotide binding domain protein [Clostridioides difficile CD160]|uniref:CobQ/CobB/MinD/ParA nucleotide binding domain-containing protein n=1 Tax=Clostridioides difficile TaxID=1496 RepID=A0A386JC17_CLODI|nr:chromosome partitioning protein ParA [Clostridioides difficile]AYD68729.1 CobQ/CobB/MinD/ParA nucleotide binding domain-containing protein [Clostridioides difficile]EQF29816.1 cobQ/CobB/MinD/ParA nucleotide binding domain protein [Clostridioides difficile CD160]
MKGKTIAIWGSPSSGKTTFSIKLAKKLAEEKKDVILVFSDLICPSINTILPNEKIKDKSLGNVLSAPILSEEVILTNLINGKNKYINILGYKQRENVSTYAQYNIERVLELFRTLENMAYYIIVDCTSYFFTDLLTSTVLEYSDTIFRLVEPSLKAISYFDSNLQLLMLQKFKINKHINVLSNFREDESVREVKEIYRIKYELPYLEEIREQTLSGDLFQELSKKKSQYNKTVDELASTLKNEDDIKKCKLWRNK